MSSKSMKHLLLLVFVGVVTYLLSPVLLPFFIGGLLAYIGDPLVSWMARHGVPRLIGVIIVFVVVGLLLVGLLFLMLPLLAHQLVLLAQQIALAIDWVQNTVVPWLSVHFGTSETIDLAEVKLHLSQNISKTGGVVRTVLVSATQSSMAIISMVSTIVLIPVVAFYLLRDWPLLLTKARLVLPQPNAAKIVALFKESDAVVGAFFKGQLLVMVALGTIYSVGLWLVGLKVGLVIGLISGLLAIVPYLGFIVGIAAATIAALIQFQSVGDVALVWVVYAVGQCLESMVLTPLLVGDRIGLHPVVVIFAVLAGGVLFGMLGVLLALPVAAVIKVFLAHLLLDEESDSVHCEGINRCN